MREKGKGQIPIYRHRPVHPGCQIRLNRKSRAKIKQSNRQWTFKGFEINGQDELPLWKSMACRHQRRRLRENALPLHAPLLSETEEAAPEKTTQKTRHHTLMLALTSSTTMHLRFLSLCAFKVDRSSAPKDL